MPVGGFTSEQARERFLRTYDEVRARVWPQESESIDVPTSFGSTRVYRIAGDNPGDVPFVLLMGSAGNALGWYAHVRRLARSRPVIAIDPIGQPGASVQTRSLDDGRDWAQWLDEVLAGLGNTGSDDVARVHLVGISYGGWVALQHALHSARPAASLALLDPGGFGRVTGRFMAWVIAGGLAALSPRPIRHLLARPLRNAALRHDEIMPLAFAAWRYRSRHILPTELTDDDLARVTMPALALLGEHSQLFDAATVAARIKEHMPDVRVEIVPGASHDLPVYDTTAVVERLVSFTVDIEARA